MKEVIGYFRDTTNEPVPEPEKKPVPIETVVVDVSRWAETEKSLNEKYPDPHCIKLGTAQKDGTYLVEVFAPEDFRHVMYPGKDIEELARLAWHFEQELGRMAPDAFRGKKVIIGASHSGGAKAKPYREKRALYEPEIIAFMKRNPSDSLTNARRYVAEEMKVSYDTVKRHTKSIKERYPELFRKK